MCAGPLRAEFLYAPTPPYSYENGASPNGFIWPTLDYEGGYFEYSAWDIMYVPHTAPNYPDLFAPYGGQEISPGVWAPITRTAAGFTGSPYYNPGNPLAFWDTRNPTITQSATSAFIIGPDISGNIYTFSEKTSFVLANDPDYAQLGTVVFQFQTDGSLVDFSSIKLTYSDGFNQYSISALDAEYLREYQNSGGGHWSAAGGYSNRVAIQWDLSNLVDPFGNPITNYQITWSASASSMSLQKVDLVTSEVYQAGIPISAAWTGGNGTWSNDANWALHENSGLTAPQENGNIKFQNSSAVSVVLDQNFDLGELIFESAPNVDINADANQRLLSNTGVTTRSTATGTYTINTDFEFGALNFFEINAGTVVMNGVLSGNYGMVKSGAGTLVLANDNSFTGFLGVQGGTVRVEGNNAYTGTTTVVNGRVVVALDAGATGALGSSTSAISVGADESLFHYAAGTGNWMAELMIDGDHEISRNVQLAPGDFGKRLGAFGTTAGAVFSGAVNFTGNPIDTESASPDTAAGNVYLSAQGAGDRLTFSGAMTGGSNSKTVRMDGQGTVVYAGTTKTYGSSTIVERGTWKLNAGSGYTGAGNVTVNSGAVLHVDGTLAGSGTLALNGMLIGSGTVNRSFEVANGAVISPGNSPGTLTTSSQVWGGGGIYLWEIRDINSVAGTGWDLLNVTGNITFTATSAMPFEIQVTSLLASNLSGELQGFDQLSNYAWTIASASGGVNNFSEDYFRINTDAFANEFSGAFRVILDGNDIVLNYTAVPEPGTWALLVVGAFVCLARVRKSLASARQ